MWDARSRRLISTLKEHCQAVVGVECRLLVLLLRLRRAVALDPLLRVEDHRLAAARGVEAVAVLRARLDLCLLEADRAQPRAARQRLPPLHLRLQHLAELLVQRRRRVAADD